MNQLNHATGGAEGAEFQQFLTFRLDGEEYGIGILSVMEIQGWSSVTTIPQAPPWVLGVMELRGLVVPVIDLRKRFGMPSAEFGPSTVVIVIRVDLDGEDRTLGLVVDAVSEVCDVDSSTYRELPDVGTVAAGEVVHGLAFTEDRTLILLDAERLAASTSTH